MGFVESIWRTARAAAARITKALAGSRNGRGGDGNPWEEVGRELDRARRYGREFALVRIPAPVPRNGSRRTDADSDAAHLSSFVRTVDRVWTGGGATYALLPETGRAGAEALLARVARHPFHLLAREGVRTAAFPEDGVTSGALIEALEGRRSGDRQTSHRDAGSPRVLPKPAHALVAAPDGILAEDLERMIAEARSPALEPAAAHVSGGDGNGAVRSAVG